MSRIHLDSIVRLTSYILAADPAWVRESVLSYYDLVEEIVVSYDKNGAGWTGAPIPVDECIERLKSIDKDKKMRFIPGDYARPGNHPMVNDTYQRQCALEAVNDGADWVLEIDADEILPNPSALVRTLEYAAERGIPLVEWPMRVFFHRLPDGRFLEICTKNFRNRFEYPGPIAVRPGAKCTDARHALGKYLRAVVVDDRESPQICATPGSDEARVENLRYEDAILHFSWARSPEDVRCKVASWSHNEGFRSWLFYHVYWKSAPLLWRWLRNLHPFVRGFWPRLKPTTVTFNGAAIP